MIRLLPCLLLISLVNLVAFAHPTHRRKVPRRETVACTSVRENGYEALKRARKVYERLLAGGGWPELSLRLPLIQREAGKDVYALKQRLLLSGELSPEEVHNPWSFDEDLANAVRHFQLTHGLKATGEMDVATLRELNVPVQTRLDTINANLERWNFLPCDLGTRYIYIDITGYEMRLIENGKTVLSMRALVGAPDHPTPVFSAAIRGIVLDPWWTVPHSIAVAEALPDIHKDPGHLKSDQIQVYDNSGGKLKLVDPSKVNWSRVTKEKFHYVLRQPPGEFNPLGNIKFVLPNLYEVYMHGSANPDLFKDNVRAISHGCVRIENPLALALYLLKREKSDWTKEKLQKILDQHHEYPIRLHEIMPVYFVYRTAWVDEKGDLQFRPDVYGWDGWDTEYLKEFLRRGNLSPVAE